MDNSVSRQRNDLFNRNYGVEDESSSFLSGHLQSKTEKLARQDEIMDELHESVKRFGTQTHNMRNEIEDHLGLITAMQDDLEENQNTLDLINHKANDLIEKSGGECRVICVLSCISFVLFLLILS